MAIENNDPGPLRVEVGRGTAREPDDPEQKAGPRQRTKGEPAERRSRRQAGAAESRRGDLEEFAASPPVERVVAGARIRRGRPPLFGQVPASNLPSFTYLTSLP